MGQWVVRVLEASLFRVAASLLQTSVPMSTLKGFQPFRLPSAEHVNIAYGVKCHGAGR